MCAGTARRQCFLGLKERVVEGFRWRAVRDTYLHDLYESRRQRLSAHSNFMITMGVRCCILSGSCVAERWPSVCERAWPSGAADRGRRSRRHARAPWEKASFCSTKSSPTRLQSLLPSLHHVQRPIRFCSPPSPPFRILFHSLPAPPTHPGPRTGPRPRRSPAPPKIDPRRRARTRS